MHIRWNPKWVKANMLFPAWIPYIMFDIYLSHKGVNVLGFVVRHIINIRPNDGDPTATCACVCAAVWRQKIKDILFLLVFLILHFL